MKRRPLLRSAVGFVSAGVFGATGWLMGTRALTMPPPPSPCTTFCEQWEHCSARLDVCVHYSKMCDSVHEYDYSVAVDCTGPFCVITNTTGFCNCPWVC
jgi:hypothetical protein